MFERSEVVFRLLCVAVGAVLLFQVVRAIRHSNPLAGATIPALPALPSATNTPAEARNTNAAPGQPTVQPGTNAPSAVPAPKGTNTMAPAANPALIGSKDANPAPAQPPGRPGTNTPPEAVAKGANPAAPQASAVTNALRGTMSAGGTNVIAPATNAPAQPSAPRPENGPGPRAEMAKGRVMAGAFPGGRGRGPELPPQVQARVDRIIESEILGPVMRPQPMALLGIFGQDVFLQAPDGQTGLLKEGEELGGVKLLKIDINRVLLEEQGEKKELSIFSGLGSESLLSKQTNNPQ